MKKYDVFGVGNPITDILLQVEDSFISGLSLNKGIMRLVDEGESKKILAALGDREKVVMPGGSCCNTMIGVANLGGRASFTGMIGNDLYGEVFEEKLLSFGVKSNLRREGDLTGTSVILITPDSERTMNTCLAACSLLKKKHIDSSDIKESKIFHTTAYLIDTAPEAGYHALEIAKSSNIPISFDMSDPFLIRAKKEELKKILKDYAEIVFLNEEEAKLFTGMPPQEALTEISKLCKTVLIKLGAKGSLMSHEGKIYRIAPFKVSAIDTTGAGDMYAAGFLFGITNGYSVEQSGKIASFASAKQVEVIGARLDYSLKDEIKRLF